MKNFSIIIPIYNESGSIFKLVEEIYNEFKNKSPEIVIVNDGSNDDFDKIKSPRYKKVKDRKSPRKSRQMYGNVNRDIRSIEQPYLCNGWRWAKSSL